MAALLWLWAALAAGLHFTEMPSLFNLSPTVAGTSYVFWGTYELYLLMVLALFIFFTRPASKIWIAAGGIALLVVVKVIWLEPLLNFRAQTIWDGVRPFNFIPLLYVFSEIAKLGLLLSTSYWIFRDRALPGKARSGSNGLGRGREISGHQVHHPT